MARRSGQAHPNGTSLPPLVIHVIHVIHKKPENVHRYFKPSAKAIAEVTSLLALGDSRC